MYLSIGICGRFEITAAIRVIHNYGMGNMNGWNSGHVERAARENGMKRFKKVAFGEPGDKGMTRRRR